MVSYSQYEKIPIRIFREYQAGSIDAAREVATVIREKQSTATPCRLALGTGSDLYGFYDELLRLHEEEDLSFHHVELFQIAEYYPLPPNSIQSNAWFLENTFVSRINILRSGLHFFNGAAQENTLRNVSQEYERKIADGGGLDCVVSCIGSRGHIGFNAPGSFAESETRIVTLDRASISSAASVFFGESNVPVKGFTLGLKTLMNAEKLICVAWGEDKADTVSRIIEDPLSNQVPASIFQNHQNICFLLDESAARGLTRSKAPWIIDTPEWDSKMIRKAVVWLCRTVKKPILKLTDRDYNDHYMNSLLSTIGSAYKVNIKVFNELQHTITGWPGGKPNADDTNRPERAEPSCKRIVIFSPHPDDDVISMGGTLIRLADQGHDVHIAYQTSGNIAVFDEDVLQIVDFFQELHLGNGIEKTEIMALFDKVREDIRRNPPGQLDSNEVSNLKTCIRKSEAKAACRLIGIADDHIHFLDMPFYNTGLVEKRPLEPADINIVFSLLESVKPHQIYAAGDLNDPHGTHQTCLEAIVTSLQRSSNNTWMNDCRLWLYRGAWQEWPINEIDMVVPMSPDELTRKRKAIFKHQSQKDSALFPGSDSREFWQRAEARNRELAELYNQLGLAEYEAMEGFKIIPFADLEDTGYAG